MRRQSQKPDGFHDECGLFGIYGHGDVTDLIYYGLYALQHRGQEGAGMVLHNGEKTRVLKGLGLVSDPSSEIRARLGDRFGAAAGADFVGEPRTMKAAARMAHPPAATATAAIHPQHFLGASDSIFVIP